MRKLKYDKLFSFYTEEAHVGELFALLNDLFYDGALPDVHICLKDLRDVGDAADLYINGEFRMFRTESGEPTLYLNPSSIMSGPFSNSPRRCFYFLCGYMLHEMCHYYCSLHGVRETDQEGEYHNLKFKDVAMRHGLNVRLSMSHPKEHGYNSTELSATAENAIDAALLALQQRL